MLLIGQRGLELTRDHVCGPWRWWPPQIRVHAVFSPGVLGSQYMAGYLGSWPKFSVALNFLFSGIKHFSFW